MKTRIFIFIVSLCCGAVLGHVFTLYSHNTLNDLQMAEYETLPYKVELIKAFENYHKTTETLLDSIENHYSFCDAFDAPVQDYLWARYDVDSLLQTTCPEDTTCKFICAEL